MKPLHQSQPYDSEPSEFQGAPALPYPNPQQTAGTTTGPADGQEERQTGGNWISAEQGFYMRNDSPTAVKQRLPLLRPKKGRIFCGVCRGLSLHLGVAVSWVRVAFVLSTFLSGAGVLAYIFLWVFVPAGDPLTAEQEYRRIRQQNESAPLSRGNVSAVAQPAENSNDGRNRESADNAFPGTPESLAQAFKHASKPSLIALIGIGLIAVAVTLETSPLPSDLTFGSFMMLCGIGVAWIRFNAADGQMRYLLFGLALIAGGYAICSDSETFRNHLPTSSAIAGIALLAAATLAIVPLANRFILELGRERAEKEREEERADMTAHLQDGVLQTLALIQLHSNEPKTVFTLARKQERELRRWLYQERVPSDRSVSSGLKEIAARIEDEFGEPINVVTVGDTQPSAQTDALLNACGQAILNAAQHGAEPISVYCEVGAANAEVFVRDHGNGFNQDEVPPDRLGIRQSIIGRIERHGGNVGIVSRPGWGTEVHMTMPIPKGNGNGHGNVADGGTMASETNTGAEHR